MTDFLRFVTNLQTVGVSPYGEYQPLIHLRLLDCLEIVFALMLRDVTSANEADGSVFLTIEPNPQ